MNRRVEKKLVLKKSIRKKFRTLFKQYINIIF